VSGEASTDYRVIDRHVFVPHYLAVLANGMIWSQSRFYLKNFGLGINEIRLLTVLAHSPGLTSKGLGEALVMNKSIVSRSVAELTNKKMLDERLEGRARHYSLTDAGLQLNRRIVKTSLAREARLLRGFSPNDKTILLGYLARMLGNLDHATDGDLMQKDLG